MLDRDEEETREVVGHPRVVERRAGPLAPRHVVRVGNVFGRHETAGRRRGIVAVLDDDRITTFGIKCPPSRQQNAGSDAHLCAPERRHLLAHYLEVLHPLGFSRELDGWQLPVQADAHAAGIVRIEGHARRLRDQVAWLAVPGLAVPMIHGELHDMTIGTLEGRVDVEPGLDPVVASRHVRERSQGIAERARINPEDSLSRKVFQRGPEQLRRVRDRRHIELRRSRKRYNHASVERYSSKRIVDSDVDVRGAGGQPREPAEGEQCVDSSMEKAAHGASGTMRERCGNASVAVSWAQGISGSRLTRIMVVVYEAHDSIEAHLLRGLLEQAGITARILGEDLIGGIGEIPAQGLLRLVVSSEDFESARTVVANYEDAASSN